MILSSSQYEEGTTCLLCPSLKTAEACRSFALQRLDSPQISSNVKVHLITQPEVFGTTLRHEIFARLLYNDQKKLMMGYWMFSGEGISSRLAEECLLRISGDEQHQSELGLPLHPDHVHSDYYQKHIPLSSVKDAKDAIRMRYAGIIQGGGNIGGVSGFP